MTGWGRRLTRSALWPAALLLLGACAGPLAVSGVVSRCATVDDKAVKYINWARVPEVNIRIRNAEFEPMIVRMRQGWPYVLRIRNRDHETRVFSAHEFFQRVAVIKATVAGEEQDFTCFGVVAVPPRQSAELRLVALTDGYYEYEDSAIPIPIPGLFSTAPNGIIIIEERTPRI
jgi:hypothetical protein